MMFRLFAPELRHAMKGMFFDTRVLVERETAPGTWLAVGTFDASAQQPRSDRSMHDPTRSTANEAEDIVFFVDTATPIREGMRLTWRGTTYRATTVEQERSTRAFAKVTGTRMQSAVFPTAIRFRRLSADGSTFVDVGTFNMRVTLDLRGGYDVQEGGRIESATASGNTQTGTMVGVGPESGVVETGDVFGYEGLPGRVATENRSDPSHPRYGVIVERETV